MLKNYRIKHTCNDDTGIGRRKQQQESPADAMVTRDSAAI